MGARDEGAFRNPVEGPAMLSIGIVGTLLNLLCLCALRRTRELKLSPDYLFLLRLQSTFDLAYLVMSTPVTALPYAFPSFRTYYEPHVLPYVFPFVQISMIASIYTTIALALERYLSIREAASTNTFSFPCRTVVIVILVFSVGISAPRFFELRPVKEEHTTLQEINNTGILRQDFALRTTYRWSVKPTATFYTVGYFLGYNMIGSFLISMFIPVVALSMLNTLIWRRLRQIWGQRGRLGVREKRNTRAALVLVLLVLLFFVCHTPKLVVSGYQLVDSLINPVIRFDWPRWVEILTFVSHFFLALCASVNILLYCSCDRRFIMAVKKTLWPFKGKNGNRSNNNNNENTVARTDVKADEEDNEDGVGDGGGGGSGSGDATGREEDGEEDSTLKVSNMEGGSATRTTSRLLAPLSQLSRKLSGRKRTSAESDEEDEEDQEGVLMKLWCCAPGKTEDEGPPSSHDDEGPVRLKREGKADELSSWV